MGVVEECKEIYYVKCTLAKTMHVIFTKFKSIEGITMNNFFFLCRGLFCVSVCTWERWLGCLVVG